MHLKVNLKISYKSLDYFNMDYYLSVSYTVSVAIH